jgi:hypothetical protein
MQTTRFTRLLGITLTVMLTLPVGQGLVFGHDDGDRTASNKLEGTWDVTLRFPESSCNNACNCPGNTPNIPLPTLNTFLKHGGMLYSGTALVAGPGQGVWERLGHRHFMARFKFFIFDLTTARRTGTSELTKDIRLTGPDTFEATTTYDLFDTAGNPLAQGCIINESATRFE